MLRNKDLLSANSEMIAAELGRRLNEVRLTRNIRQEDLAADAGVSVATVKRLAAGEKVSLDSFIRVAMALGLVDHLAALLPEEQISPMDLAKRRGKERVRASGGKREAEPKEPWRWGDES